MINGYSWNVDANIAPFTVPFATLQSDLNHTFLVAKSYFFHRNYVAKSFFSIEISIEIPWNLTENPMEIEITVTHLGPALQVRQLAFAQPETASWTGFDGDMEVSSSSWGYPKLAGWFISWQIPLKWMRTGGTPILGNPHINTSQAVILNQAVNAHESCELMVINLTSEKAKGI